MLTFRDPPYILLVRIIVIHLKIIREVSALEVGSLSISASQMKLLLMPERQKLSINTTYTRFNMEICLDKTEVMIHNLIQSHIKIKDQTLRR